MTKLNEKLILLLGSIFLFFGAAIYMSCSSEKNKEENDDTPAVDNSAIVLTDEEFVGEQTCKSCHQQEFDHWKTSDHFRAMQTADSTSVLGNFGNISFINKDGMKSKFFKKNGEFWVNTQGGDGKYHDYKIIYTFGFNPLQQYIIEYPKGRFQCLTTAWNAKENKWFDLYPDLHIVHSEWLHQSKGAMTWNTMCADCHSTNLRKNFDEQSDSFDTKYSIINVSCEACHGPGKKHVERLKDNLQAKYSADDDLQMTKTTTPHELVEQCARCHMRREQFTLAYNHKGTLYDHYFPQLLTEGTYHADGQILDEVYVYGSFLQSKMYMNNVKCTDCHEPHTMKLKLAGNALCGQCHEPKKYDTELHTFHTNGTDGAQCVNCHMPGKYYMVNDFRRDHSLRIPRPDLSIKYGTPNACNECHNDKSNEWAWEHYKKWYGDIDSLYTADVLAMGRAGDTLAISPLIHLSGDEKQSPMARATAVTYLGRYADTRSIDAILTALNDKEPVVRGASVDALSQINADQTTLVSLLKMLSDEKRTVRVKAFSALAGFPEQNVPQKYQDAFKAAKKEFTTYLRATADFPGGQANRALYYEKTNQTELAIKAYEKAIEMDNYNNIARNNLANLYYQKKDFGRAEDAFRKIIEQEPGYGPAYYSLGLLLAETKQYDKAVAALEKAVQYTPENLRVRYNLGLIYQNMGKNQKAENVFKEGLQIDPKDESLLYALFYFYNTISPNRDQALDYINRLVKYYPENDQYKQIAGQLIIH